MSFTISARPMPSCARQVTRVLTRSGSLILFEPYISLFSYTVYGMLHHEPVAWKQPIDFANSLPRPRDYYAAQGNATRLFFRREIPKLAGWLDDFSRASFQRSFSYLLSGGYEQTRRFIRQKH